MRAALCFVSKMQVDLFITQTVPEQQLLPIRAVRTVPTLCKLLSENKMNDHIAEDVTRLRDELAARAFNTNGEVKDAALAEVVYKINSCLFKGYPRRTV